MWYYIEKVLKYDDKGNFGGVQWYKIKNVLNKARNLFIKVKSSLIWELKINSRYY